MAVGETEKASFITADNELAMNFCGISTAKGPQFRTTC